MQRRVNYFLYLIMPFCCLNTFCRHLFSSHSCVNLPLVFGFREPLTLHNIMVVLPFSPFCIYAAADSHEWHFDLILTELHLLVFRLFLQFISIFCNPLCKLSMEPLPHPGLCFDECMYAIKQTWSTGTLTYTYQKSLKLPSFNIQW